MKDIGSMTIDELLDCRTLDWDETITCRTIIIVPGPENELHDSGYRMMTYVFTENGVPIGKTQGGSDVLHIGGIGGTGREVSTFPKLVPPTPWSIDCLPKSGLLQLFSRGKLKTSEALSSFEVFVEAK
jgi:hypothetical protein